MLSLCITYHRKSNQNGVGLTNLYKLRNAHQSAPEGVMDNTLKMRSRRRKRARRSTYSLGLYSTYRCEVASTDLSAPHPTYLTVRALEQIPKRINSAHSSCQQLCGVRPSCIMIERASPKIDESQRFLPAKFAAAESTRSSLPSACLHCTVSVSYFVTVMRPEWPGELNAHQRIALRPLYQRQEKS